MYLLSHFTLCLTLPYFVPYVLPFVTITLPYILPYLPYLLLYVLPSFTLPYLTLHLKVHPHGQQLSYTTLYNKVVQHKTCSGHAKISCATNVHKSTIFFINLARLQRKK